jgi:hypothetical protein
VLWLGIKPSVYQIKVQSITLILTQTAGHCYVNDLVYGYKNVSEWIKALQDRINTNMPITQSKSNRKRFGQHGDTPHITCMQNCLNTGRNYGRHKALILTFNMVLSLPKQSRDARWISWRRHPNLTTPKLQSDNVKTPNIRRMLDKNIPFKPPHSILRSVHWKCQEPIRTQHFYRYNGVTTLLQLGPARGANSRPVAKTLREVCSPGQKRVVHGGKGSNARAAVI